MPNRMLREGLLDSDAVGMVSPGAEMLFVRLMLLADDFGRYDGRVSVICRRAFVNRRSVDEHMTGEWLHELHDAGLVRLYDCEGKPYLEVLNFRQRTRAQSSKYPSAEDARQSNQPLSTRFVGHTADKRLTDDRPPRTETETETETEYPLTPKGVPGDVEATGGCTQADSEADDDAGDGGAAGKRGPITLRTWLAECAAAGEMPIPGDSAPVKYAATAGIPDEFVLLHWREFKTRNAETGKRQKDWRRTFLNSLRGNWYGIWMLHPDGTCSLTTKGAQAKRVQEALMADEGGKA
jgi:hypothetical protein